MSTPAMIRLRIEDEEYGEYTQSFTTTHDGYPEAILGDTAPKVRKRLEDGRPLDAISWLASYFDHHDPSPYSRANHHRYAFRWENGEWTAEELDEE